MNETIALAAEVLGRKLETPQVSADELEQRLHNTDGAVTSKHEHMRSDADGMMAFVYEYIRSPWIRGYNTIANATRPDYGGALDARELYPDIKSRGWEQVMAEFATELKAKE